MSNGCKRGQHWDDACQCCVDNDLQGGFQTLYMLTSQVTYVAIRRVCAVDSKEAMAEQLNYSTSVMKKALTELTKNLPRGFQHVASAGSGK